MNLYDYQEEIVSLTKSSNLGTIILPTGTGKTVIEGHIILEDIKTNKGIYLVNAPRILLTFQLLLEIYTTMTSNAQEALYMFVHSGGSGDEAELEKIRAYSDISYSKIESSTNVSEIKIFLNKCKTLNLPGIIFSTYNSMNKVELALENNVRITINDEAHYLVQDKFHSNIITKTDKQFFFTATAIYSDSDKGKGMQNTSVYGEILYSMTPKEAIERGKMIRPRIHLVKSKEELLKLILIKI